MGGTAMDSVIASLFCNGVYNSQSMGIGGGFLMTYYNAKVNLILYGFESGEIPLVKQVQCHTEKSCIVSYYRQFSKIIK